MNKRSAIESRRKIMKAAKDVFSRHGYGETNIREISKKAGMSVGGIYLYFKSKEELYKNLINEGRREIAAMTETTIEQSRSATEALSNFLKLHLDYAVKHREFILLHIREHGFAFGLAGKRQFFQKQRRLIESVIDEGIRSSEFRKCNVRETANIIHGALRGVILSMALDDIAVRPEALNELVFQGLLRPDKKI